MGGPLSTRPDILNLPEHQPDARRKEAHGVEPKPGPAIWEFHPAFQADPTESSWEPRFHLCLVAEDHALCLLLQDKCRRSCFFSSTFCVPFTHTSASAHRPACTS